MTQDDLGRLETNWMTQSDLKWPRTDVENFWRTFDESSHVKSTTLAPFWGPSTLDISTYSGSVTSQRETTILCDLVFSSEQLPESHRGGSLAGFQQVPGYSISDGPQDVFCFWKMTFRFKGQTVIILPSSSYKPKVLSKKFLTVDILTRLYCTVCFLQWFLFTLLFKKTLIITFSK